MKKLKLGLDDLRVESFTVGPEHAGRAGTVKGHESGVHTECFTHCLTACEQTCWVSDCFSGCVVMCFEPPPVKEE